MSEYNSSTIKREKEMQRQRGHWPSTMDRAIRATPSKAFEDVLIEELAGLMTVFMKFRSNPTSGERRNHLCHKIADVELMLAQIKRKHDTYVDVEHFKIVKMFRLKEMLDRREKAR